MIGTSAAFLLGIYEDVGLTVSGAVVLTLSLRRRWDRPLLGTPGRFG
jgi:hypothetical protein